MGAAMALQGSSGTDEEEIAQNVSEVPSEVDNMTTYSGEIDDLCVSDGDDEGTIVVEPEDDELDARDCQMLTDGNRVLTLEDLEDYVPQEGETFGSGTDHHVLVEKPSEISVLQREINEPVIGKPIVLNVVRPVPPAKPRMGFFGSFKEHISSMFSPGSLASGSSQARREKTIPIHVTGEPSSNYSRHTSSFARLEVQPTYCSEVQRGKEGGQQSFKTQVSCTNPQLHANRTGHSSDQQEEAIWKAVTERKPLRIDSQMLVSSMQNQEYTSRPSLKWEHFCKILQSGSVIQSWSFF